MTTPTPAHHRPRQLPPPVPVDPLTVTSSRPVVGRVPQQLTPGELLQLPAELLTTEAVARALHVAPSTVTRWIREGQLEAVKAGRGWRVSPAAVRAWLAANTRSSRPLT